MIWGLFKIKKDPKHAFTYHIAILWRTLIKKHQNNYAEPCSLNIVQWTENQTSVCWHSIRNGVKVAYNLSTQESPLRKVLCIPWVLGWSQGTHWPQCWVSLPKKMVTLAHATGWLPKLLNDTVPTHITPGTNLLRQGWKFSAQLGCTRSALKPTLFHTLAFFYQF